jgi:DDE superfamily endonuclease
MLILPHPLAMVLGAFAPMFSKRVFAHVKLLIVGAILAPGKRTVTSVLRVMGKSDDRHFQNYHRVLSRAQWPALRGGRILLRLLVRAFVPTGPVVIGIDETIERRRGEKIAAKGIYRDPVRSSHAHLVKASGLRWVSLMLLTPIPWTTRVWGLPFLTVLSPSERYYQQRSRSPRTLLDRARQAVWQVRRWLPERELVIVGDHTYAALEWLDAVRRAGCVITRLRLDAALYEPALPRQPRQNGRPRKKGKRLPTLEKVLTDSTTPWTTVTVANWYGGRSQRVQLTSDTAVWYHSGKPVVPIRWVVIRDPKGRFEPQALLATNQRLAPAQILTYFVRRWQLETTFEEARAHLGVETQRQWSNQATARTTPALLALYSIVTLMAAHLVGTNTMPVRTAAWYDKAHATFSDTIALVRHCLWRECHFSTSQAEADVVKIPHVLFERLTDALCYAA